MKSKYHLISPIGTSILRNYSQTNNDFSLDALRGKGSDDETVGVYFVRYKNEVIQFMESKSEDDSSCAETRSIDAFLKHEKQDTLDGVTMLPTDTAESYLAFMFINEYLKTKDYNIDCRIIKDLSYSNAKNFESIGLKNLLEQLKGAVIDSRKRKITPIINATAGFKAESAMVLLMAQFLKVDVFYIHELMKEHPILFPNLPVELEKSFWEDWRPVIKTVLDADNSDSGVLDVTEFRELTKYLDFNKADFLFDINEDFGGVSLSVLGFLIAEGFDLEIEDISLPSSNMDPSEKLFLNEAEMSHAPKGSLKFMKRLAELDFVKIIKNLRFENTAESRMKTKYDDNDPSEVQLTHSDGDKGLNIMVKTTARDKSEHYVAKSKIALKMNILTKEGTDDENHNQYLYNSGELLRREFKDDIISMGELIRKAEDIISEGEKITKPYEQRIEKERKAKKLIEKTNKDLKNRVINLEKQNNRLKSELGQIRNDNKGSALNENELNLEKLSKKFNDKSIS